MRCIGKIPRNPPCPMRHPPPCAHSLPIIPCPRHLQVPRVPNWLGKSCCTACGTSRWTGIARAGCMIRNSCNGRFRRWTTSGPRLRGGGKPSHRGMPDSGRDRGRMVGLLRRDGPRRAQAGFRDHGPLGGNPRHAGGEFMNRDIRPSNGRAPILFASDVRPGNWKDLDRRTWHRYCAAQS